MNLHVSQLAPLPEGLTVDEFLAWATHQPKGKYELFDGKVVMQQAERWVHAKLKTRLTIALDRAIDVAGAACFVVSDGPLVRIDQHRAFQSDLLVANFPEPDRNSLEIANPLVVVEILSPSTATRDLTDKLAGYFSLPVVQHYLVVDPDEETILWYRRAADGGIDLPKTISTGSLQLYPPGIEPAYASVFAKREASASAA